MTTFYLFNRETEGIHVREENDGKFLRHFNKQKTIIVYWVMDGHWAHWHPDTIRVNIGEDMVPNAVRALHLIGA